MRNTKNDIASCGIEYLYFGKSFPLHCPERARFDLGTYKIRNIVQRNGISSEFQLMCFSWHSTLRSLNLSSFFSSSATINMIYIQSVDNVYVCQIQFISFFF